MLLREARALQLCATPRCVAVLENDSRILPVTRAFAEVKATAMSPRPSRSLCYRDGGDERVRGGELRRASRASAVRPRG